MNVTLYTPKQDAQARIAKYTAQVRAAQGALDAAKADLEEAEQAEREEAGTTGIRER